MSTLTELNYEINPDLLFYNNKGFPKQALIDAIKNKNQSTLQLLEHLEYAYLHHEELIKNLNYYGTIHATYLLAQFQETRAFPLLLKLLSLPANTIESLYGDFLSVSTDSFLVPLYNGDFEALFALIANSNIEEFIRVSALRSLFFLVHKGKLNRKTVIDYFKELFDKKLEPDMHWLWDELAIACVRLNAVELKKEIDNAIDQGKIDPISCSYLDVDELFSLHLKWKEEALENFLDVTDPAENLSNIPFLYDFQIMDLNSPVGYDLFYDTHFFHDNAFSYRCKNFPKEIIQKVLNNKEQSTKVLLEHLEYVSINYEQLIHEIHYYGLTHTAYILAQFREKQAFPLLLKLCSLPPQVIDDLFDEILIKEMHRLLASTYNDDFKSLTKLIEDPKVHELIRDAALRSFIIMVSEKIIDRDWVINYIKHLTHSGIEKYTLEAQYTITYIAKEIQASELTPEINKINEHLISSYATIANKRDFEKMLESHAKNIHKESTNYSLISDALTELEHQSHSAIDEESEYDDIEA
ncbi:hypothetical protein AYO37_00460 [Opitutia bacterium SCGC AG-212-L18]|nr:hypothetical protein AYO37_00460 [Opitutae bacterium SCGC AG-212-L18]